ncbi:FG-GAP-like repeat-containing protein [Herbidospora cretacea]|uniref:FG-GAP-like repeat-containing protein n=1 Tax=Herbidospora cretacea TaxID=28444 RepID=UPI0012DD1A9B|nr:FG-GAP-like repeat-containing protein [Herbidospora cretacea]
MIGRRIRRRGRILTSLFVTLCLLLQVGFQPTASAATTVTLNFPMPDGFDRAELSAWANEFNNRNDLLSETIREEIAAHPADFPGARDLEPREFDGAFTVTSTGVSVTVESDVQTSNLSWWEEVLMWVGVTAGGLVFRVVCVIGLVPAMPATPNLAKGICAALQVIISKGIVLLITALEDGPSRDWVFWERALGSLIVDAVSALVWEVWLGPFAMSNSFGSAFEKIRDGFLSVANTIERWWGSSAGFFRTLANVVGGRGPGTAGRLFELAGARGWVPRTANLRVMPMGDSITVGYGGIGDSTEEYVGYRRELLSGLRTAGHSVDFVGTQDSGAGTISDSDHEGHGGWRIDQIDDIAECTVRRDRPNVVLLHIGTNDMNRNFDVGNAHHRLAALIRKITNAAPETTVLVSGLVPSQDDAINTRIAAYNSRIPDMARTLAGEGRRVRALSMDAVTEADLRDKLHPGQRGYDKMGRVFHSAISAALREQLIASPVAGNPSACQMPEPASPAEGWNAVEQISAGYGYPRDWVRFADMDGDNRDDYLIVQDLGQVRGWLNGGDGRSWTWRGELNAGYGYPRDWVRFADMDGDNRDDYVILQDLGEVRAWLNNGVGQSWTWKGELAGYGYPRDWVRLEDVNGDGLDDYVVIQDHGELRAWINNGPGKPFTWKGEINPGYGYPRDWVRLEDVNADKKVDYLVVQNNGQVRAWLNDIGGKGWIWQGQIIGDVGVDRNNVRLADVNGDRKTDYLGIGPLGQIGAWFNGRYPGGPTPGNPTPVDPGPPPASPGEGWNHIVQISAGYSYPRDWVRFADMNGDNRDDYLILQDLGQLRGWQNDGTGQGWTWKGELNPGYGYPRDWVRLADMNGDNRDDYVILQDLGQLRAWQNDGDGTGWTWKGELNPGYGYPRDWVRLEDVNGDGLDDYLVLQDEGELRAWINNGPGQGWTWKGEINPGYGYPRDWVRLEDVNGDRKVDYLVVQDDGQVRAWLNDIGGKGWIWQGQIIGDVGVDRNNMRLHDVNGDRKVDYLGIGPLGQIGAWYNNRYPGAPDNPPPAAPIPPDGWPRLCVANRCP